MSLAAPATDAGFASLRQPLDESAHRLGLSLTSLQSDRLIRYLELLAQWNRTYNLTAIREPRAMLSQHVADCLATVLPLRRETASAPDRRILDVGSGGGLPGLVLAIAAPEFEVVCVDSVGKKAAFIRHAAGALGLDNISAHHARVEALAEATFSVVTSRAFSTLSTFLVSSQAALAPGGVWMAMKGKVPAAELAEIDPASHTFHVEQVTVPDLDAERCIVWVRRYNSERSLSSKRLV